MKKQYLVVLDQKTGACELANVGVFQAATPQEAKDKAKDQWRTTRDPYVINVDGLPDGWSYYQ